jgi:predicted P-loop ATPase
MIHREVLLETPPALSAVLGYARRGWAIFPVHTEDAAGQCSCRDIECDSVGKHPRIMGGRNAASRDEAQIRTWAQKFSGCNWAIATGAESGIFVFDVDGATGSESLLSLQQQYGNDWADNALQVETPHGGHLYFQYPKLNPGLKVKSSVSEIGPSLDVRGDGGYALVPPSKLHDGFYGWATDALISDAPAWLLDLVVRPINDPEKPVTSTSSGAMIPGAAIPNGKRNTTLTSLGGTMRRRGMSPEAIEAALHAENIIRCQPALSKSEVSTIAGSVARYAPPTDVPGEQWRAELLLSETGKIKPLLANVLAVLRNDPKYQGLVAYNEFSLTTLMRRAAPWDQAKAGSPWTDFDDSQLAAQLQQDGIPINTRIAAEAVAAIAQESPFHPVRSYLRSLRWDQQPRVNSWLSVYFGAESNAYTCAVGQCWLISAIARIMRPGCKVDQILLLEGPQGCLKSTGIRTLAGDDWFCDHISTIGDKDSRLELCGTWIFELAELDRVRRGELSRVKAFFSAQTDVFRPPYGRRTQRFPRSCVFVATANDTSTLVDETGNRRWWPIRVAGRIDVAALARDRDQLWAEAVAIFDAGEKWWLESAELNAAAAAEADERYQPGVWDDEILNWCANPEARDLILPLDSEPGRVTIADVLLHCVGKTRDKLTYADQMQVQRCLVHAGFTREKKIKVPGTRRNVRFYTKEKQ